MAFCWFVDSISDRHIAQGLIRSFTDAGERLRWSASTKNGRRS